jgi:ADP-sugar diphosphatase
MYEGIQFSSPSLTGTDFDAILASSKFQNWYLEARRQFTIEKIEFESVNFFGPLLKDNFGKDIPKSNVAFIKFNATVKYGNFKVPGIVFMRGGCVAILIVVHYQGRRYALLVRQARFAIGKGKYLEIPAGMLDHHGTYVSAAATEVFQETGIRITENCIKNNRLGSIYPSPGACDEIIEMFYYDYHITDPEEFKSLHGRLTGNAHENEHIKCILVDLDDLKNPECCTDPKAIVTYTWYMNKAQNI